MGDGLEWVMEKNVGTIDKVVRVVIGLGLVSLFFVMEGNLKWLALLAIVPFGTSLISFCPLYRLLGVSTCSKKVD